MGHLLLFWGFVGAAVTSGLLIFAIYVQGYELPLPLLHPYKILGNISAVARRLQVCNRTVYRWLRASGLDLKRLRAEAEAES